MAVQVRNEDQLAQWVRIVRGGFLEEPGLMLTRRQVQRLWGLDAMTCDVLLQTLVASKFLTKGKGGQYRRADQAA
jgi:hypothetical protein